MLACLVSGVVVAAYSVIENGFAFEVLGLMLLAFLDALVIAFVVGVPLRLVFRRFGKERGAYYSAAGLLAGTGILAVTLVMMPLDASLLKLTLVLAMAGLDV